MTVTCSCCGLEAEALERAPMPTPLGRQVLATVCQGCFKRWQATQVMLINEHRLNLLDPEARRALEGQMRAFLHLE